LAERGAESIQFGADAVFWYFGDDYDLYRTLRDRLPDTAAWGDAGSRLTEISTRHRDAFVNLDEGFDIFDANWWTTRNIAERGPYSSDFTVETCRFLLFKQLLNEAGRHVFLVERRDMARVLREAARTQGHPVRQLGGGFLTETIQSVCATTLGAVRFFLAAIRRCRRLALLRRIRRGATAPLDRIRNCDVLLATWTKAGDFPSTQSRSLAHSMGDLPQLVRARGLTVGYIALPLDEVSEIGEIYGTVVRASDPAVLPDDGLTYRDIVTTALKCLKPGARAKADFTIGGHRVSLVASMILARERFDWRAVEATLWSRVGPWLASAGCRPKAVFHVYENQTWEKGLRRGFRAALPDCRTVGCHQSPMSMLYLNMLPSRSDLLPGGWPDSVVSHGPNGRRRLTDAGAPADRVIVGGLLRQGAFLHDPIVEARGADKHRIVCATGPSYQECLELVDKAAAAVAQSKAFVLLVNFHPLTTDVFRAGIRRFIESRHRPAANIEFTGRSIRELLDEGASAVLYADTNSGFESASAGARTINVTRDTGLAYDKLPDGLSRRVGTAAEIRLALAEVEDDSCWPTEKETQKILGDCFTKVDIPAIMSAAGLDATPKYETINQSNDTVQP